MDEGVIDTGTSLTYLDSSIYDALMLAIIKQKPSKCGLKFEWTSGQFYDACYCEGYGDFAKLSFDIDGHLLEM
jgi:hypothetical protein